MPDSVLDTVPPLEMVDGVPVVRLMATQRLLDHAIDAATAVIRRMVVEGQPHLLVDARRQLRCTKLGASPADGAAMCGGRGWPGADRRCGAA